MTTFGISFDYRCPATYVAHTHVLDALEAGADWDVTFHPFSLSQAHVAEGETPIWDRPQDDSGIDALQVAMVVRDQFPDSFKTVHRELFAIRHVHGKHLSRTNIDEVLSEAGVDPAKVWKEVATGKPLQVVRNEHTSMVEDLDVWGVPTFIHGDRAVFVNLRDRPDGDGQNSRAQIERILDLIMSFDGLREFKHTSVDH